MSTLVLGENNVVPRAARPRLTPAQSWGLILILPYALIFLLFVVYPVLYGLWLARHPASYVELSDDPIFWRSVANTSSAST
jgi:multiple sugar transport system permease protein